MNAAIVDDSVEDIELLYSYLSRYCQENKIHIYIEKFTDADTFLDAVCDTAYHLVFLDIYLKCMTGIQVAKKIQIKDPRCRSSLPQSAVNMHLRRSDSMSWIIS